MTVAGLGGGAGWVGQNVEFETFTVDRGKKRASALSIKFYFKKVLHKYNQILIIVNSVILCIFKNSSKFSIEKYKFSLLVIVCSCFTSVLSP